MTKHLLFDIKEEPISLWRGFWDWVFDQIYTPTP